MENNEDFLKSETAGGVITSACGLWLHISILSMLIFIVSIIKSDNFCCSISAIFSMLLCQCYAIRLNLDEKLFRVLYKNLDTENFDRSLEILFNKKLQEDKPLLLRWLGTKKLLQNSILWLIIQIAVLGYICFIL